MKIQTEGSLTSTRTPAEGRDAKNKLLKAPQQLAQTIGNVLRSVLFLVLLVAVALPLSLFAMLVPDKNENE